jgi:type IV pilus assembly protein PilV
MNMKHRIQGFSMIEVLVSVVIVSLGMLGIAGALLSSTRSATSSYLQQQAVQSAYDIIERMRANDSQASIVGGPYTAALGPAPGTTVAAPTPNCSTTACTPAQMAAFDIWQWQTQVQNSLPSGEGSIAITTGSNSTSTITITVQWIDTPGKAAFSNGAAAKLTATPATYTLVSAL